MSSRLTILTSVRLELQETTPGFWTDAELNGWLDEANGEVTRAARVEASAAFTMTAQTENVALPADFFLARRIELQSLAGSAANWRELRPLSLDLRRPADPTNPAGTFGSPFGYFIYGTTMTVVPSPDQGYSGTIYYFKNATPFTGDTDTPVYPEGISQLRVNRTIFLYTCAMALRKRQDAAYTTYAGDYNSMLKDIEKDTIRRGLVAPMIVKDDWAGSS